MEKVTSNRGWASFSAVGVLAAPTSPSVPSVLVAQLSLLEIDVTLAEVMTSTPALLAAPARVGVIHASRCFVSWISYAMSW